LGIDNPLDVYSTITLVIRDVTVLHNEIEFFSTLSRMLNLTGVKWEIRGRSTEGGMIILNCSISINEVRLSGQSLDAIQHLIDDLARSNSKADEGFISSYSQREDVTATLKRFFKRQFILSVSSALAGLCFATTVLIAGIKRFEGERSYLLPVSMSLFLISVEQTTLAMDPNITSCILKVTVSYFGMSLLFG
jgi:hypothetical protein